MFVCHELLFSEHSAVSALIISNHAKCIVVQTRLQLVLTPIKCLLQTTMLRSKLKKW